jgi:hypothetical protein
MPHTSAATQHSWVFHRGALGDSVLLWPLLRSLLKSGSVTLVSHDSHAQLAQRWLNVTPLDAEQARFSALWVDGHAPVLLISGVTRVIAFDADPQSDSGRIWRANAAKLFPGAAIELHPGRTDRPTALQLAGARPDVGARRLNPGAPIVLHVGAGSRDKRWPMDRWAQLVPRIEAIAHGRDIIALAGEVEVEQFDDHERDVFASLCPTAAYLNSLNELSDFIEECSLFIAADTGPGHLAAAVGVSTISLFGPTDPARWAPIGPSCRIVAPASPRPMDWLAAGRVMEEVQRFASGPDRGERTL